MAGWLEGSRRLDSQSSLVKAVIGLDEYSYVYVCYEFNLVKIWYILEHVYHVSKHKKHLDNSL